MPTVVEEIKYFLAYCACIQKRWFTIWDTSNQQNHFRNYFRYYPSSSKSKQKLPPVHRRTDSKLQYDCCKFDETNFKEESRYWLNGFIRQILRSNCIKWTQVYMEQSHFLRALFLTCSKQVSVLKDKARMFIWQSHTQNLIKQLFWLHTNY